MMEVLILQFNSWLLPVLSLNIRSMFNLNFAGKYSCFTYVVFFLSATNLSAQHMDRTLNIFKKEIGLEYHKSRDFSELDSLSHYWCGRNVWVNPFIYNLVNKDKEIVIAIQVWAYKDLKQLDDNGAYYGLPANSANTNYLKDIKYFADTIHSQVIHYPSAYVKKKFNADDAGEYLLDCPLLYRKKYAHCQVVFLHKKKRGDLQLFYFYTDDAKNKIEKCIRKTAGMIRYQ